VYIVRTVEDATIVQLNLYSSSSLVSLHACLIMNPYVNSSVLLIK
jgi:hypothetical protein